MLMEASIRTESAKRSGGRKTLQNAEQVPMTSFSALSSRRTQKDIQNQQFVEISEKCLQNPPNKRDDHHRLTPPRLSAQ